MENLYIPDHGCFDNLQINEDGGFLFLGVFEKYENGAYHMVGGVCGRQNYKLLSEALADEEFCQKFGLKHEK